MSIPLNEQDIKWVNEELKLKTDFDGDPKDFSMIDLAAGYVKAKKEGTLEKYNEAVSRLFYKNSDYGLSMRLAVEDLLKPINEAEQRNFDVAGVEKIKGSGIAVEFKGKFIRHGYGHHYGQLKTLDIANNSIPFEYELLWSDGKPCGFIYEYAGSTAVENIDKAKFETFELQKTNAFCYRDANEIEKIVIEATVTLNLYCYRKGKDGKNTVEIYKFHAGHFENPRD